jgi:hypothetical protein
MHACLYKAHWLCSIIAINRSSCGRSRYIQTYKEIVREMASRKFLLLIVVALVPFAMARQDPSDKEASQVGKDLKIIM